MERISSINKHFQANQLAQSSGKSPNDVVICCAVRTPLTKSKRGFLKDTSAEMLLLPLFKAVIERTKINPSRIQDVIVGNVLQPGAGVYQTRMSQYLAGWPDSITTLAINRLCSSGLEAVSQIAAKIQSGVIDIGIGGGVENMSLYEMKNMVEKDKLDKDIIPLDKIQKCLLPMGITSENVAQLYGIDRKKQDAFAALSHQKAARAQELKYFDQEIVSFKAKYKDKDGKLIETLVSKDEGIRKDTTAESLSKLKPAFKKDGSTTAGNSSQLTDGAAVVLLARRSVAESLNLPIIAKFVSYAVAGVPPELMGIGPAYAIPEALKKANLTVDDIDVYELNEAFASQATYCVEKLKIDPAKVNPKGGAIALGHPLGATGARQIATLLPELVRTKKRFGVVSMCIGTGMGAAGVFENELI